MEEIELLKVLQEYLFFNSLPIKHVSKMTGIPYTTLMEWYHGRRKLNVKNAVKIRDYLNGKYEVEANQVANYLMRGENHDN